MTETGPEAPLIEPPETNASASGENVAVLTETPSAAPLETLLPSDFAIAAPTLAASIRTPPALIVLFVVEAVTVGVAETVETEPVAAAPIEKPALRAVARTVAVADVVSNAWTVSTPGVSVFDVSPPVSVIV